MAAIAFVALAANAAAGAPSWVAAFATAAAGTAGAIIDQALIYPTVFGKPDMMGPRIDDLQIQSASEGAPVPYVLGTARVSGTIIWLGRLQEVEESTGGKGGGGGASSSRPQMTSPPVTVEFMPYRGGSQVHNGQPMIDNIHPLEMQLPQIYRYRNADEAAAAWKRKRENPPRFALRKSDV